MKHTCFCTHLPRVRFPSLPKKFQRTKLSVLLRLINSAGQRKVGSGLKIFIIAIQHLVVASQYYKRRKNTQPLSRYVPKNLHTIWAFLSRFQALDFKDTNYKVTIFIRNTYNKNIIRIQVFGNKVTNFPQSTLATILTRSSHASLLIGVVAFSSVADLPL